MSSGQPLAAQPAGSGEPDRSLVVLIGAIAGVALAGLGVTRLARRRATVIRAGTAPSSFVFPPFVDTPPANPISASTATPPFTVSEGVVPVESVAPARRTGGEPITLDHGNTA